MNTQTEKRLQSKFVLCNFTKHTHISSVSFVVHLTAGSRKFQSVDHLNQMTILSINIFTPNLNKATQ